jgi:hypothetical protein
VIYHGAGGAGCERGLSFAAGAGTVLRDGCLRQWGIVGGWKPPLLGALRNEGVGGVCELGHDGEEAVGGGDYLLDIVAAEDFLADDLGVLGSGDDGDAFPRPVSGPGGDEFGEGDDGEEVVEAGVEIGGEAELEAAGIVLGLELEEVELAFGCAQFVVPGSWFRGRRRFAGVRLGGR